MNRMFSHSVFRFGVVGVAATVLHVSIGLALHVIWNVPPFWANLIAFCMSFSVSYAGNHRWTFKSTATHGSSAPRFAIATALGLVLNQGIVYVVTTLLQGPYPVALALIVTLVPPISYLLGRFWVFRNADRAGSS